MNTQSASRLRGSGSLRRAGFGQCISAAICSYVAFFPSPTFQQRERPAGRRPDLALAVQRALANPSRDLHQNSSNEGRRQKAGDGQILALIAETPILHRRAMPASLASSAFPSSVPAARGEDFDPQRLNIEFVVAFRAGRERVRSMIFSRCAMLTAAAIGPMQWIVVIDRSMRDPFILAGIQRSDRNCVCGNKYPRAYPVQNIREGAGRDCSFSSVDSTQWFSAPPTACAPHSQSSGNSRSSGRVACGTPKKKTPKLAPNLPTVARDSVP